MSTTVDNRVVEMRFDNQQFEQNANKSISTLEKLKQALKFDGKSAKAFEDIGKSSRNLNLDALAKNVDALSNRFSTLGIIGMTALQNITNKAINAGERLAKSLSIDQATRGFDKYEAKVNAVQVMAVNTGKSIEIINQQLEKLQKYTDDTSYSYSQMVDAIGKFTAAGVDLETAETMTEGIANWAATAGVNAQKAGIAFYNLAQAAGAGSLKMIDAKSLNLLNMFTPEFNKAAMDAAVAVGTLRKEGDKYYTVAKGTEIVQEGLQQQLTEGWFDLDVMTEVLSRYADTTDELGAKAFNAAYEAKTFTDALEAVKDTLSSGWSQTFEAIFGNYEEAKRLWTEFATIFQELLGSVGAARNEILQAWAALGGNSYVFAGLYQLLENILNILSPIRYAFIDIFGVIEASKLAELSEGFMNLMKQLAPTESTMNGIYIAFKGVFSIASAVISVIKAVAEAFSQVLAPLTGVVGGIGEFLQFAGYLATYYVDLANASGVFEQITVKLVVALSKVISVARDVAMAVGYLVTEFFKLPAVRQIISDVLYTIASVMLIAATYIEKAGRYLGSFIAGIRNMKREDLAPYFESLNSAISVFWQGLTIAKNVVVGFFGAIALGISQLVKLGKGIADAGKKAEDFGDAVRTITLDEEGFTSFDVVRSKLDIFQGGFGAFVDSVIEKVNKLDTGQIVILAFGAAIVATIANVARAIGAVPRLLGTTNKVMKDLHGILKKYRGVDSIGDTILKIAGSIAILAGSFYLLSRIKPTELGPALAAMITMMAFMGALVAVSAGIAAKHLSARFASNAQAMLSLAASVAVLAGGLRVLSGLSWKEMKDGIKAIGDLMIIMVAAAYVMSNGVKSFAKGAISMVITAAAIDKLVGSLLRISTIPTEALKRSMDTLAEMMLMLTVLTVAASGTSFGASAGLLAMVGSIILLEKALGIISNSDLSFETILANIDKILIIVGALVGLMKVTQLAGENAMGGGVAILAMTVSIHLLIGAMAELGILAKLVGPGALLVGVAAVFGIVVIIGKMMKVIGEAKEASLKAVIALVPMTVCIGLLGALAALLGRVNVGNLIVGLAAIEVLTLIMGQLIKSTEAAYKVDFKPILSVVVGMGTIIAGLALLSFADPGKLLIAALSLSLTLGVFGTTLQNVSDISQRIKIGPILALTATIAALVAGLAILSNPEYDWVQMGVAAASLSVVMLALGKASELIGDSGLRSAGSLVVLSVGVAALAGSLYLLAQLQFDAMVTGLLGLVGVLAVLAGGLAILTTFAASAPMIAALGGAIATVTGAIALLGVAVALAGAGALGFANAVSVLISAFMQLTTVTQEGCQNLYNVIVAFFGAIGTGVATMIVNFFATILTAIGQGLNQLHGLIGSHSTRFQADGSSVMSALAAGIISAMPWPVQAIATGISAIASAIRGGRGEMESAGSDMAAGIASGVNSAVPEATESGKAVGKGVEDGVRDALAWHSPMVEKFGKMLMDLALGIASGQAEGSAIAGAAGEAVGDATGMGCYNGMAAWMPDIKAMYQEFCNMRDDMAGGLGAGDVDGLRERERKRLENKAIFDKSDSAAAQAAAKERMEEEKQIQQNQRMRKATGSWDFLYGKKGSKASGGAGGGGGGGGGGGSTKDATKEFKKLFDVMEDGGKVVQKYAEYVASAYKTTGDVHPLQLGKEAVQKLAEKIYEASVKTVDAETQMAKTSEEKLAEMREAFLQYQDNIRSTIEGQTDMWGGLTQKSAVSTKQWTKDLRTQRAMVGQWQKDLQYAAERVNDENIMSWIIDQGPTFDMQLKKLLSSTDAEFEAWEKEITSLDDLYDDAVNSAMAAFAAYYTKLEESTESAAASIEKDWSTIGTVVSEAGSEHSKVVSEFCDGNEQMGESAKKLAQITKQSIEGAMYDYITLRDAVSSAVNDQIDLFSKFDTDTELTGDELHDNMQSQIHGLRDWSAGMTQLLEKGLDQGLYQKLAEMGPKSYEYVQAFLDMTAEQLNDANAYFQQSLTIGDEIGQQLGSDFAVAGLMASEGFRQGIDQSAGVAEVKQMALNVVNAFRGDLDIHSPSGIFMGFGQNLDEGLSRGITMYQTAPIGAITTVATLVKERAANGLMQQVFFTIGQNITRGLANGIEANSGMAVAAAERVASRVKETIQDAYEINSPSRWAARMGTYINRGFASGLLKSAHEADDAATEVTNGVIDSMKAVVGHIADIITGEVQVDPTIRPVLDLTNIEDGASRIDSMFGGTSYSLSRGINIQNQSNSVSDLINQLIKQQESPQPQTTNSPINIYVYGAQGQSEEELANIIESKLRHRINRMGAVWT